MKNFFNNSTDITKEGLKRVSQLLNPNIPTIEDDLTNSIKAVSLTIGKGIALRAANSAAGGAKSGALFGILNSVISATGEEPIPFTVPNVTGSCINTAKSMAINSAVVSFSNDFLSLGLRKRGALVHGAAASIAALATTPGSMKHRFEKGIVTGVATMGLDLVLGRALVEPLTLKKEKKCTPRISIPFLKK
ncbi:hypothetical protein PCE1_003645 [Barthelona sp. PCE]